MEEEYQEGISFGRICKVAFRRWKLLLIITLAVGLVGFFATYFGYNYLFSVYGATFSYSGSGLESERMADNTTFNYKSLISKETLNEVKALREEYASINIDKLVKDNEFSITRDVDKDSEEVTYTITIERRKMPSKDIARNFLADLANYPLKQDKEYINSSSFDSALTQFDNADKCEDRINYLYAEGNTLISGYNTMKAYDISSDLAEKIDANIRDINAILDSRTMSTLSNMIVQYGLATDYSKINVELLQYEKLSLDNDDPTNPGTKQKNEKMIEDINAQIAALGDKAAITDLNGRVTALIVENNNIEDRIRQIDKEIANATKTAEQVEGNALFVAETTKIRNELAGQIPTYKTMMNEIYVKNATVLFENSNVLDVTKDMSLALSIIVPLVAGLAIGLTTNLILDRKMLRDEELPAEQPVK